MKKYLAVGFFATLLLLLSPSFAQDEDIYAFSISPAKPIVSDPMSISVGVKNPLQFEQNYKLYIYLVKDGGIKDEQEYTFNLRPNAGTFFSAVFYPNDIGKFDIVVRLSDKFETKLFASRTESINVVSEIGPFDLVLDVPSQVVRPRQILPLQLTLANMGDKGTDVEVKIQLPCFNKTKIENSFFVFLDSKSTMEKMTSIPTCSEEGLHDIYAHIILFNKTFLTSVNQIMLNNSVTQVSIKVLDEIGLEQMKPRVFSVSIENEGVQTIHDLRLLIENIPLPWVSITPDSINMIEPGQTVIFIVNVTVPQDAKLDSYPIKVVAAADEFLKRADSKLKVLRAQAVSQPAEAGVPIFGFVYAAILQNLIAIETGGIFAVGFVIAYAVINKRRRSERVPATDKLRKLKDVIRGV